MRVERRKGFYFITFRLQSWEKVMGMRIGSGGGGAAMAQAVSSVAQWQQAKVAAPTPVPAAAQTAQLVATLTQGNNVNTYA